MHRYWYVTFDNSILFSDLNRHDIYVLLCSRQVLLGSLDTFDPYTFQPFFFSLSTVFVIAGRFEPEVVEERRAAAEAVLNFCCQHRHLYTDEEFVLFFEGGVRSSPQSSQMCPVAPFDFSTFRGPQSEQSICSDATSSDVARGLSVSEEPEEVRR